MKILVFENIKTHEITKVTCDDFKPIMNKDAIILLEGNYYRDVIDTSDLVMINIY